MSVPPGGAGVEVARLRGRLDRLAETLFEVDSDPDVAFVRTQPGAPGAEVVALADRLWPLYPLARDALDRLDAAVRREAHDDVALLLTPAALNLPDGRATGIGELIESLQADAEAVLARARDLAGAARRAFAQLDTLTTTLTGLDGRADRIGAGAAPELQQAHRQLDGLVDRLAADPLVAPDVTAAERAVREAVTAVDRLEASHATLSERLERARAQLDELARLIPDGAQALADTRAKIVRPVGLLEPVDAAVLDGDERSLRPWLTAIAAEAAGGAWLTADAGLARWQQVADGWTANARQVLAANRRQLDRRDELRGLLEAYQAKAAASGRAEDVVLAERHGRAHDALWTAPCDLEAAERAVRDYIAAVNASPTARTTKDRA